ncbi:hypothetical protein CYMTET_37940 [Cymbomonas tetramitiformis]|uniref:Protochlorophyllide reductase n=1 Tax=Cymbomonas tetramitiformis TaxID=36881 RepID=A0AAE0CCX0_9CHLO|nr:hypothetical protein CYMTET_37940 [Cymbomonas tetramitiformis]
MTGSATPEPKQRPSEYFPKFFEELPSMAGKNIVVTGASRGLGFVTALSLAKKGASLFLLNRRSTRAEESLAVIAEACSGPPPQLIECDLLDFASVRAAAGRLAAEGSVDGIDVLCCNAGVMLQPDQPSKDGYDITISANVLSHFLLTRELMPQLEKAATSRKEARIVNMSSGSGFGPPAFNPRFYTKDGGNLGGQKASYERYHQSKLANLLLTSALADKLRIRKSRVKALACTPGVCGTDMFAHVVSLSKPGEPVDLSVVPSVEDGSLAQLKCICEPSLESGQLFGPPGMGGLPVKIPLEPPTVLVDTQAKVKLWEACERAVGAFEL